MNARAAWLLEVSAPEGVDRFVARTSALALRWLSVELAEWWALGFALEGTLSLTLCPVIDGVPGAAVDLRRFISLSLDALTPTRLDSHAGVARLARRLELQPDEEPTFVVDERSLLESLPPLDAEPVAHGTIVVGLLLGAHLADATRTLADLDPPPPPAVELPPEVARLSALVYAAPEDDVPRLVLADALEEAGDPRGVFIREQVMRARTGMRASREEQRLLERHADDWLKPVAGFMSNVTWERGFPVEADLGAGRWLARPDLSTLRRARVFGALSPGQLSQVEVMTVSAASLDGLKGSAVRELYLSGYAPPLTLRRQPSAALARFSAAPPPHLRKLWVDDGLTELDDGSRLIGGGGRMLDASDWAWLWETALGAQLDHFDVMAPFEVLESWLQLAEALPIPMIALRVCQHWTYAPLWLRLLRGSRLVYVRKVEIPPAYDDGRPSLELLEAVLASVPWLEGISFDEPSA